MRPEAKIVILNESLKSLDELTLRQIVYPNIWAFVNTQDVCLIVISKSYSIIREVDCILVFDRTRGTVAHAGSHQVSFVPRLVLTFMQVLVEQQARLYMQFMFPWAVHDIYEDGINQTSSREPLGREASCERRNSQDLGLPPENESEGAGPGRLLEGSRSGSRRERRLSTDDWEFPSSSSLKNYRKWKSMADFTEVAGLDEQDDVLEETSREERSPKFLSFTTHQFHSKSFSDFSKITSPAYQRKSKRPGPGETGKGRKRTKESEK